MDDDIEFGVRIMISPSPRCRMVQGALMTLEFDAELPHVWARVNSA